MIKYDPAKEAYNCDGRLRQYTGGTQMVRNGRATRSKKACKSKLLAHHNLQTIAEEKQNGKFCFTQNEYSRLLMAMMPTKLWKK